MRWGGWLLLGVVGCGPPQAFPCSVDAECDGGVCAAPGYCAFEDEACSSGFKFGQFAGPLSNQCTEPPEGTSTGTTSVTTSATSTTSTTLPGTSSTSTSTGASTVAGEASTGAACPEDWWDCAWSTRSSIDVDFTGSALSDFPVLVVLDPSRIDYALAAADGSDVRFVLGDQPLSHERASWDPSGVSELWVRLPALPVTAPLFVYYGNGDAPDSTDPSSVWTADYLAVFHLDDESDVLQALSMSAMGVMPEPGLLGTGLRFDGMNALLSEQGPPRELFATGGTVTLLFTAQGWGEGSYGRFIDSSGVTATDDGYAFGLSQSGVTAQSLRFGRGYDGSRGTWYTAADTVALDQWTVATVAYRDDAAEVPAIWIDGEPNPVTTGDTPMGAPVSSPNPLAIGVLGTGAQRFFDGVIDELHLATTQRSDDWSRAEYLSLTDQLLSFGPAEGPPS